MAIAPNSENYTLGKGRLFFNQMDTSGNLTNEMALGNAPNLTFSLAVEKLDHYSSTSGLRAKDKTVVTEVTPTVAFTLDEINRRNLRMLFYGTETAMSQLEDNDDDYTLTTDSLEGAYYETGKRNIGVYRVAYDNRTTSNLIATGTVITDSTWSATVLRDIEVTAGVAGTGILYIGKETGGTIANDDAFTASSDGGDIDGAVTWLSNVVVVGDATFAAYYEVGTDYVLNSHGGLIGIAEGSSITDASTVHAAFAYQAESYYSLSGLETSSLEGQVRFVSDNPEGPQMEARFWKVSLSPDGDTAFIGDDWSTMSFTGEILKDETGHPTKPYLELLM